MTLNSAKSVKKLCWK